MNIKKTRNSHKKTFSFLLIIHNYQNCVFKVQIEFNRIFDLVGQTGAELLDLYGSGSELFHYPDSTTIHKPWSAACSTTLFSAIYIYIYIYIYLYNCTRLVPVIENRCHLPVRFIPQSELGVIFSYRLYLFYDIFLMFLLFD